MKEAGSLIRLRKPPSVTAWSSTVGQKEAEGPLGDCFDIAEPDSRFGQETWEQAESELQRRTLHRLLEKARISAEDVSCLFAGDLINQCSSSTYALRHLAIPYYGIFGACSTFAEGIQLAAAMVSGMELPRCAVLTS